MIAIDYVRFEKRTAEVIKYFAGAVFVFKEESY